MQGSFEFMSKVNHYGLARDDLLGPCDGLNADSASMRESPSGAFSVVGRMSRKVAVLQALVMAMDDGGESKRSKPRCEDACYADWTRVLARFGDTVLD
jgi:hypothetical protein